MSISTKALVLQYAAVVTKNTDVLEPRLSSLSSARWEFAATCLFLQLLMFNEQQDRAVHFLQTFHGAPHPYLRSLWAKQCAPPRYCMLL